MTKVDMVNEWRAKAVALRERAKTAWNKQELLKKASRCEFTADNCEDSQHFIDNSEYIEWNNEHVLDAEMAAFIFGVSERTARRWFSSKKKIPLTVIKMIKVIDDTGSLADILDGFVRRSRSSGIKSEVGHSDEKAQD